MKQLYRFEIQLDTPLDAAWEILEDKEIEVIYSSEDDGKKEVFGYWDNSQALPEIEIALSITPTELAPIDWQSQWESHGLQFQDGYVHMDLSLFGPHQGVLRLSPGPGFGDLSHSTTRLVIRLMEKYVHHYAVVDIGCGSGVLTVAAIALGSPQAYGIDIDPEALQHSSLNAKLNQMESVCHFSLPTDLVLTPGQPIVIVMNMIMSEQKVAWESMPQLQDAWGLCLTSGIRKEEREAYLQMTQEWRWTLTEEIEEGDWLGFAFIHRSQVE